ncbi:MAG: EAL domain-containing protein [Sulfuricaulis sp.]
MPLRLILPVMLVLFALMVGVYNVEHGKSDADRMVANDAVRSLTDRLTRLQMTFQYLLHQGLLNQVQQEISVLSVDEALQAALIVDDRGKVLVSAHPDDRQKPAAEALPRLPPDDEGRRRQLLTARFKQGRATVYLTHDGHAAIGIYPLSFGAPAGDLRSSPRGYMYVQEDLTAAKAQQQRVAMQQAFYTVAFWSTLALLLWIGAHFLVTSRMARLLRATQRLAGGDFAARSGLSGGDELGVIGRAFDDMTRQLSGQRIALQQSKQRLDLALKAARMVTWETTGQSSRVTWSENLSEILGYCTDSLRDRAVERVLIPMIKQCSVDEVEEHITLDDGNEFWLACRGNISAEADGRRKRLAGVIWDVTDRHHASEALQMLAEINAAEDENTFYQRCVTQLARAYNVSCAFIAVFADADRTALRTLVVRSGGVFLENLTYALEGTPHQSVLDGSREFIPHKVQRLYPTDRLLVELNAESYYGLPLRGRDGTTQGLVAIINGRPMDVKPWTEALLGIFASRIMHELERKQAADLLYEQKERAEVTLHSIGDAVITTDDAGRIEYLNPIAEQLTGWPSADARGRPVSEVFVIINEVSRLPAINPVARCLRDGQIVALANHTVLIDRGGHEIAIEDSAAPIRHRDGHVIGVVMVFHDVSMSRAMAQQLTWQATHDTLTGLINRREFEKRLAVALAETKTNRHQHALLYLDLDQFKIVNDTSGHVAGDELLKQLSVVLQTRMREGDVLARLGGDELGVLLSYCPEDQARRVAENLRVTVKEFRFNWEGKSFDIGVSIGLVIVDAESISVAELLSAADMACYAAKDRGRNRVDVYRREDVDLTRRHGEMQWVNRLTRAIEENRLVLYRQRMLAIASTAAEEQHYEVLVRLRGENDEIIAPGAFLPAAERYGLMPAVDRWVVRTVFAAMSRHGGGGAPDTSYAINLSGTSLNDEVLLDYVREQLLQHRIAPRRIWFEITETAAIANLPKAVHFIKEMKGLGCRFSLDDFGSGVSSFAYLKNLAVDNLKIDGGFVKDIVDDPIDFAMVQSINQIGHVMGLRTTAEFVENEAILVRLREIGVDYAQGYWIHRPEPFL